MSRGRWCRICDRRRPNERFSGRGHRTCICKDCQKRPKSERDKIDITRELFAYIEQSNISAKNIRRLTQLAEHEDHDIREHAASLLDIAKVYPHRRKRWRRLVKTHFHLFRRYRQAIGLWDDADVDDVFGEEVLDAWHEQALALSQTDVETGANGDCDIPF